MIKWLTRLILLLIAPALFAAGYLAGSRPSADVDDLLRRGRVEISEKSAGLEKEIHRLRTRVREYSIRHRLDSAQTAVVDRNFGTAQKELQKAKQEIAALAEQSGRETRKSLSKLQKQIDQLIDSADRADSRLKDHLSSLRDEFDKIVDR